MTKETNKTKIFYETRFHGRGGQGVVSAAALLALAAFEDDFESQAFPKFGSERRGAPVEAYVRISHRPIRSHSQVYTPDAIVIQDASLLRTEPLLKGLKPGGLIVLNAEEKPPEASDDFVWVVLPASEIGQRHIGRPLPNTVLLGALAAGTGWVKLAALEQAISHHLASKGEAIVKANIGAVREGYKSPPAPLCPLFGCLFLRGGETLL